MIFEVWKVGCITLSFILAVYSRSRFMRSRISFLLQGGKMLDQWRSRKVKMSSSSKFDVLSICTHCVCLILRRLTNWSNLFLLVCTESIISYLLLLVHHSLHTNLIAKWLNKHTFSVTIMLMQLWFFIQLQWVSIWVCYTSHIFKMLIWKWIILGGFPFCLLSPQFCRITSGPSFNFILLAAGWSNFFAFYFFT